MKARRLDDGNLLAPMRAEGPNGIVGDGMVEIGPDHPDYGRWLLHIEETNHESGTAPQSAGSSPEAR